MERRRSERRDEMRGYSPDRRVCQIRFMGAERRCGAERRISERRQVEWRFNDTRPRIHWMSRGKRIPSRKVEKVEALCW